MQKAGTYTNENVVASRKTCNFAQCSWGRLKNTSEVVGAQFEAHHTALAVELDPVPFREIGICVPLGAVLPARSVGRVL